MKGKETETDKEIMKIYQDGKFKSDILKIIGVAIKWGSIYKIFDVITKNLAGHYTKADIKIDIVSGIIKVIIEKKVVGFSFSIALNVILILTIVSRRKFYQNKISELAQKNSFLKEIIDTGRQSTGLNKFGE
jgi:hypothetical protein